MMILFAVALLQEAPFDIKAIRPLMLKHCRIEWPDDYSMQEYCLGQQADGMKEFKRAHDEFGAKMQPTLEKCVEEWTKDRVPDWAMIGYCAKQQADSYRRLRPD